MPSDETEAQKEIGGHAILEKLARGRAGTIYRARSPEGKIVVVRTIGRDATSGRSQEKLDDVYRRLEKVQHVAVPRVLEVGKGEQPFAVVELFAGERLDRILEDQRLPLATVLELGRTLADALATAHATGLVHTDVCARSVLVSPDGKFALVGWSAARPSGTGLGKDVPRASVRPPDGEAADAHATPALDVFGVGALLYEALAFAPPRPEDPAAPALLRTAWAPRRLNPTIPSGVEAIVQKAIEPEARRRYPNARELSADLALALAGKLPSAAPSGPLQAVARSVSQALLRQIRRRPAAAIALASVFALASATAAISGLANRSRRRHLGAGLATFDAALAKGSLDEARSALERARLEDPEAPTVLEASARLDERTLELGERAATDATSARVAVARRAAETALARARRRHDDLAGLAATLRDAAAVARPLDPIDGPEKAALEAARQALEDAAEDEARSLGEAAFALRRALELDPEQAEIRAGLAGLELERLRSLDVERDLERELRARARSEARVLLGAVELPAAQVAVSAEPPGVTVRVRRGNAPPGPAEGPLPRTLALAPGDVTLIFEKAEHASQEISLRLEPGGSATLSLRLVKASQVPLDMLLLPGMDLLLPPPAAPLGGGDVERAATVTARVVSAPVHVEPTLVATRPVTRADYAAFLRTLGAGAAAHLPADLDASQLEQSIASLAAERTPVVSIALESARAYARWRRARLPSRAELWAARARGAEGDLREWTDAPGAGSDSALVLDVRVARGGHEPTGEERLVDPGLRARDLTFRLAREASE